MRYGNPSIASTLDELKYTGVDRILILPLYPQYSGATTASVIDAVGHWSRGVRSLPELRFINRYHDDPGYIAALAQNVRDYWMKSQRPDVLVMSFHGVPRATLDKGDPYHCECQKTGRLLAEALGLKQERYRITFQSRFGRAEWLRPYTADALVELARQKAGRVDVICPGFVSDCLETLEEIAIEGKAIYLNAGGRDFHFIPCLNERNDWIHALADIITSNLVGWGDAATHETLEMSRLRALSMGAKS